VLVKPVASSATPRADAVPMGEAVAGVSDCASSDFIGAHADAIKAWSARVRGVAQQGRVLGHRNVRGYCSEYLASKLGTTMASIAVVFSMLETEPPSVPFPPTASHRTRPLPPVPASTERAGWWVVVLR